MPLRLNDSMIVVQKFLRYVGILGLAITESPVTLPQQSKQTRFRQRLSRRAVVENCFRNL